METTGQDLGSDEIRAPFECAIYRANLERASVTDCGRCVCTHCIQQSGDKICTVCNKSMRSHNFKEYDNDSPELNDSLFKIKDKEIEKREEIISERNKTIEEFKENEVKSKKQLKHMQGVMRKMEKHNQDMKKALTETEKEVVRLQDEVQDHQQKYVQMCSEKDKELKDLHENVIPEKDDTIGGLQSQIAQQLYELDKYENEVQRFQAEVERLQVYVQICSEQDVQLQHLWGNIIPEKDSSISEFIYHELDRYENEVERFQAEIERLQVYVQICSEQAAQLQNLWGNIIPEKDSTISELRGKVAEMSDEIDTLKRQTVKVANLKTLSESNVSRAIQQLQHCYDREYRCRYELTDRMEILLQTRLEDVMSELCTCREIGDQLALVISTYVSMVEENSNLHRSLRTQKQDINMIKAELRQTKVNKFEMGQRKLLGDRPEE